MFWQNTSGSLLLIFICEFWQVFQNTSFTEHLRETAFSCRSCRISTTRYDKKLFCTRTRRSHLKAFIFSKSYQPASLQKKKLFHTSSFMYFSFIFSECIKIPSSAKALKVCDIIFFQEMKAESSLTCNVLVQLRFI